MPRKLARRPLQAVPIGVREVSKRLREAELDLVRVATAGKVNVVPANEATVQKAIVAGLQRHPLESGPAAPASSLRLTSVLGDEVNIADLVVLLDRRVGLDQREPFEGAPVAPVGPKAEGDKLKLLSRVLSGDLAMTNGGENVCKRNAILKERRGRTLSLGG